MKLNFTSEDVKIELAHIEQALVIAIKRIGVNKSVELSVLKQPDISAWINGHRKWSYEKILNVAAKLGI